MQDIHPGYQNGHDVTKTSRSRPSSIYDNYGNNQLENSDAMTFKMEEVTKSSNDVEADKSPTQEFLLKTTVPQNLAAASLAGRHTPTRNSLRHSRMIVMNRQGTSVRSYYPPVIRYHRLAIVLVSLQMFLGTVICCLSAWLLVWTPNLRKRDNPYWSGLPLLASGSVGLLLLCCCRRDRPGSLKGYLISGTKIFSILLSLIATTTTLIASIFASIHIITLAAMICETKLHLNDTCFCEIPSNSTYPVKSYHYSDLKCDDIENLFQLLLICSCVVNVLAGIVSLCYIYLHCTTNYSYLYTKVRTKGNK